MPPRVDRPKGQRQAAEAGTRSRRRRERSGRVLIQSPLGMEVGDADPPHLETGESTSGVCKCRVKFIHVTRLLSLAPASGQGRGESAETSFFLSSTLALPKRCVPICMHQV